jgi:multidrug efflux pump subunit AcrA (membrane-fusion protein)
MGGEVTVTTDAFPGREFIGHVSRIPQELGVLTRDAEVEVAVDNPDRALKPGMFIRAAIEFQRRDNAVTAPVAAVVRRDDGSRGVYVVNDARDAVAFEPVTEGIVDGSLVELVNGDSLLDREVVVMGQHLLKDGIGIRVADAKPAGTGGA